MLLKTEFTFLFLKYILSMGYLSMPTFYSNEEKKNACFFTQTQAGFHSVGEGDIFILFISLYHALFVIQAQYTIVLKDTAKNKEIGIL